VITAAAAGQLQPVQRALAGQRFFQLALAAEQPQQRVGAQLLMIVEILVAQRQPVDALREHLGNPVLDPFRVAPVPEAGGQPVQQADTPAGLAQQQRPTVARYLTGREPRLYPT
jgi:hypothetical protein